MTAEVSVLDRRALGRESWDAFVDGADEAWLWHGWDLQEALQTWKGSDLGFAIVDPARKVLAVVPLRWSQERIARFVRTGVLESLGGPAFRNDLGRRRERVAHAVLEHLRSLARSLSAREIRLVLSPLAPAYRGERVPRINPLLPFGGRNVPSQSWMLPLSADRESLWAGMQGRARTAVRKAQREGVVARRAEAGDLDTYYDLHVATYERTGVTPHPRAYFELIWSRFLPSGRALILVAEHGGVVVAAQSFAVSKGGASYWTGAALDEGLRVGANNLLQWEAIRLLGGAGVEWYEAGEAFPEATDPKLRGLSDFKRSTGGELCPLYKMRIDAASPYVQLLINGREIFRTMRLLARRASPR